MTELDPQAALPFHSRCVQLREYGKLDLKRQLVDGLTDPDALARLDLECKLMQYIRTILDV